MVDDDDSIFEQIESIPVDKEDLEKMIETLSSSSSSSTCSSTLTSPDSKVPQQQRPTVSGKSPRLIEAPSARVEPYVAPFARMPKTGTPQPLSEILKVSNGRIQFNNSSRTSQQFLSFQRTCKRLDELNRLIHFWHLLHLEHGVDGWVFIVKAQDNLDAYDSLYWCVFYLFGDTEGPDFLNVSDSRSTFYAYESPMQLMKEAYKGCDEPVKLNAIDHWIPVLAQGQQLVPSTAYNLWNMLHYDYKPKGKNQMPKPVTAPTRGHPTTTSGKRVYMTSTGNVVPIAQASREEEEEPKITENIRDMNITPSQFFASSSKKRKEGEKETQEEKEEEEEKTQEPTKKKIKRTMNPLKAQLDRVKAENEELKARLAEFEGQSKENAKYKQKIMKLLDKII